MDPSNVVVARSICHVDDEIADLSKKVVLVDVPRRAVSSVNIDVRREHSQADKRRACFDDRPVCWLKDSANPTFSTVRWLSFRKEEDLTWPTNCVM